MWVSVAQKISSASRALTLPRSLTCSLTQIERVPVSIATIARSISRKRLATLAELVLESTPIDDFAGYSQRSFSFRRSALSSSPTIPLRGLSVSPRRFRYLLPSRELS